MLVQILNCLLPELVLRSQSIPVEYQSCTNCTKSAEPFLKGVNDLPLRMFLLVTSCLSSPICLTRAGLFIIHPHRPQVHSFTKVSILQESCICLANWVFTFATWDCRINQGLVSAATRVVRDGVTSQPNKFNSLLLTLQIKSYN